MLHYDETHRMTNSDEDPNRGQLLILKEEKRKCLKKYRKFGKHYREKMFPKD
jgi:hypothetical protein